MHGNKAETRSFSLNLNERKKPHLPCKYIDLIIPPYNIVNADTSISIVIDLPKPANQSKVK